MVLFKLSVPGRPTVLDNTGQAPVALTVGAGAGEDGVCSDIFLSLFISFSLWATVRYRLKYCLKEPLNPNQPPSPCL